jgi:hypothetical protein
MSFGNQDIEFDVKVNGKQAVEDIEDVEDAQEELDKTVEKTTKNIKKNWLAVGVAVAAISAGMVALMSKAIDLERAMFGLNKETKEWIANASVMYGESQEIIAGWVQTGKAAGMAGKDIELMIAQAVALGRAYPNESTETFIDNLREFYATGKEAGFITDVLENKFRGLDLALVSTKDKQDAVKEAVEGVNAAFDKTLGAKIDKGLSEITKESNALGDSLNKLAEEAGVFTAIDWTKGLAVQAIHAITSEVKRLDVALKGISYYFAKYTDGSGQLDKLIEFTKAKQDLADFENPDLDMGEIVVDGGRGATLLPAGAPKQSKASSDAEREAEKERAIALAANKRFWDDYNAITLSAYEYDQKLLEDQFDEYDKYVKDKVALDEWYNAEKLRLLEEHDVQIRLYAEMAESITDGLTNALFDFTERGKLDFKNMANSIIQDLIRIQIQASMMQLFGSFGSTGGGLLGGLFNSVVGGGGASISAFASGGVVSSPTLFPTANGAGLMAESGSEVIAPLKRDSQGNMGVGAVAPNVNVNVQNYGNDSIEVRQQGDDINIIIAQVANGISRGTGPVGDAIQSRFGLKKV